MNQSKIQIHAIFRVFGSIFLTLGVFFSIFGAFDRTVSTTFLWMALIVGLVSLVFAFLRGRSWYSGIIIFGSTYFFLMARTSTSSILSTISVILALSSSLYGVFFNPFTKSFKERLFK